VLVLLNRAGSTQPVELAVDDLGMPAGLTWTSFTGPEIATVTGKIRIEHPGEIGIWWAAR
jgi:hypothetical protein